jgi:hypothetical protein
VCVTPFLVAAWLHHRRRAQELVAIGQDGLTIARGEAAHIIALVGLVFLAVGMARTLALMVESLAGAPTLSGAQGETPPMAFALGLVAAGAATWLPAWLWILRSRATDPLAEARSPASGIHLAFVIGAAFVALVPAAAMMVYRSIDTALGGVPERSLAVELAMPVAIAVVAAVVAAYHGRLLIEDRRLVGASAHEEARPAGIPTVRDRTSVTLVLTVAADADAAEALDRIRTALGPDGSIELVDGGSTETVPAPASGGRPAGPGALPGARPSTTPAPDPR